MIGKRNLFRCDVEVFRCDVEGESRSGGPRMSFFWRGSGIVREEEEVRMAGTSEI